MGTVLVADLPALLVTGPTAKLTLPSRNTTVAEVLLYLLDAHADLTWYDNSLAIRLGEIAWYHNKEEWKEQQR